MGQTLARTEPIGTVRGEADVAVRTIDVAVCHLPHRTLVHYGVPYVRQYRFAQTVHHLYGVAQCLIVKITIEGYEGIFRGTWLYVMQPFVVDGECLTIVFLALCQHLAALIVVFMTDGQILLCQ